MFAYPNNTPIVILGDSSNAHVAYYKYRTRFDIRGFISDKTDEKYRFGKPVYSCTDANQLVEEGIKIVAYDNWEDTYAALQQQNNYRPIEVVLPADMFDYEDIDVVGLYNFCKPYDFDRLLKMLMQGKKGVLINGNCQTTALSKYLSHNPRFAKEYVIFKMPLVFQHTKESIEMLNNSLFLNNISLLLTQMIAFDNKYFSDISSEILIGKMPKECMKVIINNFWFQGYFPQHKVNEYNVLTELNKFGEFYWGDEFLDQMVKDGKDGKEILNAALNKSLISEEQLDDLIKAQFKDMRERERLCDIRMADYIEKHYKEDVLFYSCNHPSNRLFKEVVTRILRFIGLYSDNENVSYNYEYELDRNPMCRSVTEAVYPFVLRYLGIESAENKMIYPTLSGNLLSFKDYVETYLSFCHDIGTYQHEL